MRLVLASASPRRRALLEAAGFSCEIETSDLDERIAAGESPEAYVARVAHAKAQTVARRRATRMSDEVILAADTEVVLDGDVLGKPVDASDAASMLRRLSGRSHDVITVVVLVAPARTVSALERTRVWFDTLLDEDVDDYVASGEPMDKAGAYGIQGRASRFIPRIDGSYTNVVGLPIATVARLLRELHAGRPA
jgi:septum formation protein